MRLLAKSNVVTATVLFNLIFDKIALADFAKVSGK